MKRGSGIVLASVAALLTFAIGLLAGRELFRRPTATRAESEHVYDLGPYAAVEPALLGYRLALTIPLPLQAPRGIASVPDGTVWVAGDRALVAVDRRGSETARHEVDGEPGCIAVGPDGRIYAGLRDHVVALDAGGVTAWPDLGPQALVTGIAVSGDRVYVADAGNHVVMRFEVDGRLDGLVSGSFSVPSPYFDLAAGPDASLWVADPGERRVRHYSPDGALLGEWGTSSLDVEGFGGCCNPTYIAVLPCGAVVTSEKGLPRIKVYGPDGALEAVVAAPSSFRASETGLDLATRKANGGEVLVLVPSERAVRVYVRKEVAGGG